jgi:hypothetical protein
MIPSYVRVANRYLSAGKRENEMLRVRLTALDFPLRVYRGLALGPNEEVSLKGNSKTAWTWDRETAEMYASGTLGYYGYTGDDPGDSVVLEGRIGSARDVDWKETYRRNRKFTDFETQESFEESGELEILGKVTQIRVVDRW